MREDEDEDDDRLHAGTHTSRGCCHGVNYFLVGNKLILLAMCTYVVCEDQKIEQKCTYVQDATHNSTLFAKKKFEEG